MKKEILNANQLAVLRKISEDKFISENFYLTGGTALAGFYLRHRMSEDLDFFSEKEFDVSAISVFFQKNRAALKISKIDFQQSYNRNLFFLHFPDEILKTEFTYFPFTPIGKAEIQMGIKTDSALDIAVNKLFTIYQRTAARDYIDLYCIVRRYQWTIEELIKKAKLKFDWHIDPIQLGTQFIKSETASDLPIMLEKINPKDWREFFKNEAKKLKNQVVK